MVSGIFVLTFSTSATLSLAVAMLAALIYLWTQAHTFDIDAWRGLKLGFAP